MAHNRLCLCLCLCLISHSLTTSHTSHHLTSHKILSLSLTTSPHTTPPASLPPAPATTTTALTHSSPSHPLLTDRDDNDRWGQKAARRKTASSMAAKRKWRGEKRRRISRGTIKARVARIAYGGGGIICMKKRQAAREKRIDGAGGARSNVISSKMKSGEKKIIKHRKIKSAS